MLSFTHFICNAFQEVDCVRYRTVIGKSELFFFNLCYESDSSKRLPIIAVGIFTVDVFVFRNKASGVQCMCALPGRSTGISRSNKMVGPALFPSLWRKRLGIH